MVALIGVIASPSQGVSYYEKDGYYGRDDPVHREASAWAGKGAEALELTGPIDPEIFRTVLEGKVPDGPHLGKRDKDGEIHHRPGRNVTLSAPKSVSLMALVGGDDRIVAAHDRAVARTLAWIELNAIETRIQDKASGAMVRAGGQKMVAATFRHDTSRNLDPQLHTGRASRTARAAALRGTARGPVLPSATWMAAGPMLRQRNVSTSPRRQPVSASRRMAATPWDYRDWRL